MVDASSAMDARAAELTLDVLTDPATGAAGAGFVTAHEAAATLGVSERTIRRAISRGELFAVKTGRSYRIAPAALADYRARNGGPAAPDLTPLRPNLIVVESPVPPPEPRLEWSVQATVVAAPTPLTSFVGRRRELALACALLRGDDRPASRLLTLTGLGGVGKTRLALATAAALADEFREASAFVPLAPLREPGLVAPTVAQALGLTEAGDRAPVAAIVDYLRGRRFLLVLDNFEHLLAATPIVTELLAACPGLSVLATSRVRLRLTGEQELPLSPLPAPPTRPDRPRAPVRERRRPALRRSRAGRLPRLRPDRGQLRGGRRDLPSTRRPAAGDRTGRGEGPAADAGDAADSAVQPPPPADRRPGRRPAPPADDARRHRLELRAAEPRRAGVLPPPGGLRRRLHPAGGGGGRRGGQW